MAAPVAHTIDSVPDGITPTAAMVRALKASLYAVACSMPSYQGGGILGLVGAIMTGPQLLVIPGTLAWVDLIQPVQPLVIPVGTTVAAITSVMICQQTTDMEEFSRFVANIYIIRSLILDNVDNTLIGHLRDQTLNFAGVHPRDLLQHLIVTYATVTADELEENATALRALWYPSQPIVGLWARQTELQLFSVGHDDISWPTVVQTTVDILEAMGTYPGTIREWCMRAPAQHTWANLMAAFNHADQEFCRQATVSTQHYANLAGAGWPPPAPIPGAPRFPHCCFRHGVTWDVTHTSPSSTNKCEGHQDTATFDNMMGGNNTIQCLPNQPPYSTLLPSPGPTVAATLPVLPLALLPPLGAAGAFCCQPHSST